MFFAANNVSMSHQWPSSEMKASTSSVNAAGSQFVRDASGITQSRMERPQFKPDMHTSASQGPGKFTLHTSFYPHLFSRDIQSEKISSARKNNSILVLDGVIWLICYGLFYT